MYIKRTQLCQIWNNIDLLFSYRHGRGYIWDTHVQLLFCHIFRIRSLVLFNYIKIPPQLNWASGKKEYREIMRIWRTCFGECGRACHRSGKLWREQRQKQEERVRTRPPQPAEFLDSGCSVQRWPLRWQSRCSVGNAQDLAGTQTRLPSRALWRSMCC